MMDGLKMVVEKFSQYNFVTNILPGTVLCIVLKYLVGYDLMLTDDWYLLGILFYFVGMVNNRVGSLIVEPLLKACKIIKKAPYKDFVVAEKIDGKITILSTENNVYRSYISVCLMALFASLFKFITSNVYWLNEWKMQVVLVALLGLFVLSYRKQTIYVRKRVESNVTPKQENEMQ